MKRRTRAVLAATAATLVASIGASTANATYHENLIREVHEAGGDGDYVVLQAYSAGQNLLAGRQVVTYDGGGVPHKSIPLGNVANGANQATVLVGDAGVPGADFTAADFNVVNSGGAVCLAEGTTILTPPTGIDCVAYGAPPMLPPVPPASAYGTPVGIPDITGLSLVRSIGRGCPTLLEKVDDTNNSAADFAVGPTLLRNNAAPITEKACPDPSCPGATKVGTNGNDVIRGTRKKDIIDGLDGNDTITGLNGKDIICGNLGNDTIKGGNAKDRLFGGAGDDTLLGGNGKDYMDGGDGTDTCNGGRGKDKAVNCEAGTDVKKAKSNKGKGPKK